MAFTHQIDLTHERILPLKVSFVSLIIVEETPRDLVRHCRSHTQYGL